MAGTDPRTEIHCQQELLERAAAPFAGGSAAAFARRAPGKDGCNEDALLLLELGGVRGVLAVADGMGGQPRGERASLTALERLARSTIAAVAEGREPRDGILDGFETANREIAAMGVGAATTLAAVEFDGHTARSFNVGDSAVLLVGQRGKVKYQSLSHSPVGYAVEAGLLDEEQAIFHDERHLVSNAIGSADMKIEIGPVLRLAPRDTLLVASDGLFDNLRLEEIAAAIRKGPLDAACRTLAASCAARMSASDPEQPGKEDDLSFWLFRRAR